MPRRLSRTPDYPRELQEPHLAFEPRVIGLGLSRESVLARERDSEVVWRRLHLLARFHEAMNGDRIDWGLLTIRLAMAHVPGLTVVYAEERGRGRPRSDKDPFDLYRAVFKMHKHGFSVLRACRFLSSGPGKWSGRSPETLQSRFHELKSRLAAKGMSIDDETGYPRPPDKVQAYTWNEDEELARYYENMGTK